MIGKDLQNFFYSPIKLRRLNSTSPNKKTKKTKLYEREIFYKMFSPEGLKLAQAYLDEEEAILREVINKKRKHPLENIIVIGAGPLRYLELIFQSNLNYIAVDKHLDMFVTDGLKKDLSSCLPIELLNKSFEDLKKDELPLHHSIYIFTFNIFSYLRNPLQLINELVNNKNLIFISGWNIEKTEQMNKYINYVYKDCPCYIKDTSSFLNVHDIDFSQIKEIKHVEKITKKNSLVIIIKK